MESNIYNQCIYLVNEDFTKITQQCEGSQQLLKDQTQQDKYVEYGYQVINNKVLNVENIQNYLCLGDIQIDLELVKQCGDRIDFNYSNLGNYRNNLVSPLNICTNPIYTIKYNNCDFTEVILEQNQQKTYDNMSLLEDLYSSQTNFAHSCLQAIFKQSQILQDQETLRQTAIQRCCDQSILQRKKLKKIQEKKIQKQLNQQQYLSSNFNDQFENEDSQTDILEYIQDINIDANNIQQQNLFSILNNHEAESFNSKKNILQSYFSNQNYIYIQKSNSRKNLRNEVSHYGISNQLENILFPRNSFSHFILNNGINHPYHDNYSHLQYLIAQFLNYQESIVSLRTVDNYIISAHFRKLEFTLKETTILCQNFNLTDKLTIHLFTFKQDQLLQLQNSREHNFYKSIIDNKNANQFIQKFYSNQMKPPQTETGYKKQKSTSYETQIQQNLIQSNKQVFQVGGKKIEETIEDTPKIKQEAQTKFDFNDNFNLDYQDIKKQQSISTQNNDENIDLNQDFIDNNLYGLLNNFEKYSFNYSNQEQKPNQDNKEKRNIENNTNLIQYLKQNQQQQSTEDINYGLNDIKQEYNNSQCQVEQNLPNVKEIQM